MLKNLRLLHIYIGPTNVLKCSARTASGKLEIYLVNYSCFVGMDTLFIIYHHPSTPKAYVLDLSYSYVKQIRSGSKGGFRNLKLLKLSHCHNLRKTPDFTQSPNLKHLILDGCANLVGIHPSIETLKMFLLLNLKNCKNLKIFPNITGLDLESLKHLILSGCSKMLVPSYLFEYFPCHHF